MCHQRSLGCWCRTGWMTSPQRSWWSRRTESTPATRFFLSNGSWCWNSCCPDCTTQAPTKIGHKRFQSQRGSIGTFISPFPHGIKLCTDPWCSLCILLGLGLLIPTWRLGSSSRWLLYGPESERNEETVIGRSMERNSGSISCWSQNPETKFSGRVASDKNTARFRVPATKRVIPQNFWLRPMTQQAKEKSYFCSLSQQRRISTFLCSGIHVNDGCPQPNKTPLQQQQTFSHISRSTPLLSFQFCLTADKSGLTCLAMHTSEACVTRARVASDTVRARCVVLAWGWRALVDICRRKIQN